MQETGRSRHREGVVTGRSSRQVSSCAPARLLGPSPPALESTSEAEVLTPLCVLLCVSLSLNCPYTHDCCHHHPANSPWLCTPTNRSHTPRHTTWATQIIPPLHTPPTPSRGVLSKGTLLVPRVQIPFLPQCLGDTWLPRTEAPPPLQSGVAVKLNSGQCRGMSRARPPFP